MLTSAPGAVTARRAAEPRRSAAATAGIRAGLHRELNSRRARLRASDAERDEAQRAHSSDPSAFTRMEVDFWSADVSRNAMAVQDVERALARADEEEFGVCGRCGGALPIHRLIAAPDSTACASCTGHRSGAAGRLLTAVA
jgi:RNA polymerase-binding transcription factor DksA